MAPLNIKPECDFNDFIDFVLKIQFFIAVCEQILVDFVDNNRILAT
jgi:hypothetical protein